MITASIEERRQLLLIQQAFNLSMRLGTKMCADSDVMNLEDFAFLSHIYVRSCNRYARRFDAWLCSR